MLKSSVLLFFLFISGFPVYPQMFGGHIFSNPKIDSVSLGSVATLDCCPNSIQGDLQPNQQSLNTSFRIAYTMGDSGVYLGNIINSTGVSGLTASLNPGTFDSTGFFTFNVFGAPDSSGIAYFELDIDGNECSVPQIVGPGTKFNPSIVYDTIQDIEGNQYPTVVIGTQEWMAENLRTRLYNNGDTVVYYTANDTLYGYRPYEDDPQNELDYGFLYRYSAVVGVLNGSTFIPVTENVCPVGWHIPNNSDWQQLLNYLGERPAIELKSTAKQHWSALSIADNSSGFSALPGGYRNVTFNVPFEEDRNLGSRASFYSSQNRVYEINRSSCLVSSRLVYSSFFTTFVRGASIRCVRD